MPIVLGLIVPVPRLWIARGIRIENVAKIAVIGTGYVGLATKVCPSSLGRTVVCLDIDSAHLTGFINMGEGCLCPH